MPKDLASQNNDKFVPLYALCPRRMTERLTTAKAPGSVWAVIHALKAYAMEKSSCFPSHQTIQDYVGGGLPLRTIRFALKWLEDRNFIKRNSRTSKERYILYIDKHKPIEPKTKPPEDARGQQIAYQGGNELPEKNKRQDQFNSIPKPLKKGPNKQRKVRAQRRPRRRRSVAAQPPVLSPQEQASARLKMLRDGLNYIAMGAGPVGVDKDAYGALLGFIEDWWNEMGEKTRKVLKMETKDDLRRIYEAVNALQTTS